MYDDWLDAHAHDDIVEFREFGVILLHATWKCLTLSIHFNTFSIFVVTS